MQMYVRQEEAAANEETIISLQLTNSNKLMIAS